MAILPNLLNADFKRGSTVLQVAEKHACPVAPMDGTGVSPADGTGGCAEPMVCSVALEGKDDLQKIRHQIFYFDIFCL